MIQRPSVAASSPLEVSALTRLRWVGFLFSSLLILGAAGGDLWLDEINSIVLAVSVRSPLEIFTVRSDTNHLLNTLYLYAIGDQPYFFLYRLLSVLTGIASIALLGRYAAQQWGELEAVLITFIAGTAYPLVAYFSEARGYGLLMLFAILAFISLDACGQRLTILRLCCFWGTVVLGFLSHLSFIICFLSLLFWSIVRCGFQEGSLREKCLEIGRYYTVPIACLGILYWGFIHNLTIAGGPRYPRWHVISRAILMVLGLPERPWIRFLAIVLFALILGVGCFLLYRQSLPSQSFSSDANPVTQPRQVWIFFPLILLLCPSLVLMVTQPKVLYFRYFLVCFPFFYLLLAFVLGKLYRSSQGGQFITLFLVTIFLVGQLDRVVPLIQWGRGSYSTAMTYMLNHTREPVMTLSGEDGTNVNGYGGYAIKSVLNFYAYHLAKGKPVGFIEQSQWTIQQPEWIVVEWEVEPNTELPEFPPRLYLPQDQTYTLVPDYQFTNGAVVPNLRWGLYHSEAGMR